MADTESAAPIMAEGQKTTSESTQQPGFQNGAKDEVKDISSSVVEPVTSVDIETTTLTAEGRNGAANSSETEGRTETEGTSKDSIDRKRKFEDRDWRDRRNEDNRNDRSDRSRGRGGRGGFRGNNQRYNKNVRTNFEQLPESSDPEEIRKQVEFYFSDSNLLTDRFLITQVGGSANNAIPVKVIHSFKRMRHFQPYSAVVTALRDSQTLNIIGAEGAEEIQRKVPLPEGTTAEPSENVSIFDDKTRSRSIYAKGFGEETATTQFDIEAFFAPYGPTNAIRLRRSYPDKQFKGSVFVEFDSDDTAQQFMGLENKPKWEGKDLKIMSKEDYVSMKADDVKKGKIPSNGGDGSSRTDRGDGGRGRGGRGRGRGRGDRGGRGGRDGRDRNQRDNRRGYVDRDREQDRPKSKSPHSRSGSRTRSPIRDPPTAEAAKIQSEGSKGPEAKADAIEGTTEVTKKRSRHDGDEEASSVTEAKKVKTGAETEE